jgi:GNAT superfamily N-acetyltransferase
MCLEMREKPSQVTSLSAGELTLSRLVAADLNAYRSLFREIGQDWLWSSRLERSVEALRAVTDDPLVEIHVLANGEREIGLLELDFRQPGECELVSLGVTKDAIGSGAGSSLMGQALALAWSRPIHRFWLADLPFGSPQRARLRSTLRLQAHVARGGSVR